MLYWEDFPFEELRRLDALEAEALTAAAAFVGPDGVWSCVPLAEFLSAPLIVSVTDVRPSSAQRSRGLTETLLLEDVPSGLELALVVDSATARSFVEASLGISRRLAIPPPAPLDDLEKGVLLYLVAVALGAGRVPYGPSLNSGEARPHSAPESQANLSDPGRVGAEPNNAGRAEALGFRPDTAPSAENRRTQGPSGVDRSRSHVGPSEQVDSSEYDSNPEERTITRVPIVRPSGAAQRASVPWTEQTAPWGVWGDYGTSQQGASSEFPEPTGGDQPRLRVAGFASSEGLAEIERPAIELALTLQAGPLVAAAWLQVPATLLATLSDYQRTKRSPELWARVGDLPTAVHIVAGNFTLTALQLRRFKTGDVLLLEQMWGRPKRRGWAGELALRLPAGAPRWKARFRGGELIVTDRVRELQEGFMTEPADHDLPQNWDHLLDEIPIEVSAELGRVAMTARELAVLSPGAVLRFDRSPGDLLDLRVGPKLIGRGELVIVGQELGVLIRETYAEDRADEC